MKKPQHDFEPIAILSMEAVASRAFLESVRMKLYDQLERPHTSAQVAAALGMTEPATQVFLDLLEARGLLKKSDGLYANTPVASEYLVSQSPFYQGDCIELHQGANEVVLREMTDLLCGKAKPENNVSMWSNTNALLGSAQYSLRGGLQDAVAFVASLPGFMEMRTMCDLGGGHGRYATAVLDRNPSIEAVVMDLPDVISLAAPLHHEAGYGKRLSFTPYDLRSDSLPERTYDLILTSHVLYPMADRLDDVMAKIAPALKPGGWFVAHHLDPEGDASRRFRTALDLVTCLTRHTRHVLYPNDLKAAMNHAGLVHLRTGTSGHHAENVILAAQRASKE